jgi:hypothetical protein
LSPMSVVQEAIKAVPAVKWALGVGGLLAIVALLYTFKLHAFVAFVGLIVLFCFMGVLVVFARASTLRSGHMFHPAMVFTWFTLTMFMATTLSLFLSVFFSWPLDLERSLTGEPTKQVTTEEPCDETKDLFCGLVPTERPK